MHVCQTVILLETAAHVRPQFYLKQMECNKWMQWTVHTAMQHVHTVMQHVHTAMQHVHTVIQHVTTCYTMSPAIASHCSAEGTQGR